MQVSVTNITYSFTKPLYQIKYINLYLLDQKCVKFITGRFQVIKFNILHIYILCHLEGNVESKKILLAKVCNHSGISIKIISPFLL